MTTQAWISVLSLSWCFIVGVCLLGRMNRRAPLLERVGLLLGTVGAAMSALEWCWPFLQARWPNVVQVQMVPFGDQMLHLGLALLGLDLVWRKLWNILRLTREQIAEEWTLR